MSHSIENRKIKVCHIVSIDITVKFLLMPQLKFLMGEGYNVYAICSPGKLKKDIETEGIKVETIQIKRKISPFSDIISLIKLLVYFKKEKFDIVHTHAPKPGLIGQLAAKMAGVPIIINTIHGLYFTENSSFLKRKFFVLMEKIAAKCSTLIFSQNREDMETMIKEKIAKPEKIKYLGNGVSMERFNPERFSDNFVKNKKKELNLPADAKIIGAIGRLVKEKGYLELFEAFGEVLKNFPNALLLVVGPEEPEKKDCLTPEIVKNYGLEGKTIFLGERKDVDELYPLMDVFVLASHREGFPRTVLEAMAMKKPVVATNIRGCREEIDNGANGILVPLKNAKELAKAIIYLLRNPDRAEKIAVLAREKAEKEFDERLVFGRIKKEYVEFIRRILPEKI